MEGDSTLAPPAAFFIIAMRLIKDWMGSATSLSASLIFSASSE